MGLAKFGISGGRKIETHQLIDTGAPTTLDRFSAGVLSRFGFLGIAQKIVEKAPLSVDDIYLLMAKAGIPVLMKLVSLKPRNIAPLELTPIIVLPLRRWMELKNCLADMLAVITSLVSDIDHRRVHLVFDELHPTWLRQGVGRLIQEINLCRDNVNIIGPRIDELLSWVRDEYPSASYSEQMERIAEVLVEMRQIGISQLRSSANDEALELTHKSGFRNSLVTDLSKFPGPSSLAQELFRVNERARIKKDIDIWGPGFQVESRYNPYDHPARELTLLRLLAVGSISLTHVEIILAQSRYFSLEAMHLAPHLGANDLGCGAITDSTQDALSLQPYAILEKALAD
ncbi:MAG: hypothetical protein KDD53_00720 [Bdellovibrionales bacterium]|nr:hypothetical protein [Bdellovibrionales bacterium]